MTKKNWFLSLVVLREGSYNKLVAKKFAELLPEGFEAVFLEIGNLPFLQ
jgi:chromate reductase